MSNDTPIDLTKIYSFKFTSLGEFISTLISPIIVFLGLILFFFVIYGAFKYMTAGGNKEQIASGRDMIVHAIIGLVLFLLIFIVVKYLTDIFGIGNNIIQ